MLSAKMETSLSSAFEETDFARLQKDLEQMKGSLDLKKSSVEFVFRSFLARRLLGGGGDDTATNTRPNLERCQLLVNFAIQASRAGLSTPTLPILLLSDLFDMIPLEASQTLFECVEQNVHTWKEDLFFVPVKNYLLRICNDLLRRLSRTQNTIFCGRILLFLAKFFPFSERSALNVISEFNLDNTTVFSEEEKEDKLDEDKEEDGASKRDAVSIEKDEKNLNIDYALYSKFWQLQDFFRSPTQCYDKAKWKTFAAYSKDVLNTFHSFKLDSIAGKKRVESASSSASMQPDVPVCNATEQYFAKYLTNQNLLQLQLSDSNFRRYILIQFLVLFQYLQSSVKFKNDSEVLSDDQTRWLTSARDRVYSLLRETPPHGPAFADAVKHILFREEQWIAWKNDGCPAFNLKKDKKEESASSDKPEEQAKTAAMLGSRKRKRRLGDQLQDANSNKKFLMGNLQLTRLWNLCPDNMEACSAEERDFLPGVDEYFEEAMEQLNPDNMVEEQYKKVNDGQWGWRALRLLAKKSPHFFTYGNNPIAKLPDYLDQMLRKMNNKEQLSTSAGSGSGSTASKDDKAGNGDANGEAPVPTTCSDEALEKLAENLGDKWKKLLPKLGLTSEDGEKFQKDGKEDKDRALLMLKKWAEMEREGATPEEIIYILEGLKMKEFAEGVFPEASS